MDMDEPEKKKARVENVEMESSSKDAQTDKHHNQFWTSVTGLKYAEKYCRTGIMSSHRTSVEGANTALCPKERFESEDADVKAASVNAKNIRDSPCISLEVDMNLEVNSQPEAATTTGEGVNTTETQAMVRLDLEAGCQPEHTFTDKFQNSLRSVNKGEPSSVPQLGVSVYQNPQPELGTEQGSESDQDSHSELPGSSFSQSSSGFGSTVSLVDQDELIDSHGYSHTSKTPYFCAECNTSFAHLNQFEAHVQTHNQMTMTEIPFTCTYCEASFDQSAKLEKHMVTHVSERSSESKEQASPFRMSNQLKALLLTPTTKRPHSRPKVSASVPSSGQSKPCAQTGNGGIGTKPYMCKRCDAAFTRSDSLKRHMTRSHADEDPYPCGECEASFATPTDLRMHIRTHVADKQLSCEHCGATFTQADCLKRHVRAHTKSRFSCQHCGESFLRGCDLKEHIRSCYSTDVSSALKADLQTQTGEKPYACSECFSSFSRASTLKIHMRVHTGEKCFTCHECGASFGQSVHYRDHMRIHTGDKPYTCDQCQAAFAQSGHLKRHMRTHTGERCFICFECGASFAQSGNLKSHVRIHTGERPYNCKYCDATFTQSGHLKRHLIKNAGDKRHPIPSH